MSVANKPKANTPVETQRCSFNYDYIIGSIIRKRGKSQVRVRVLNMASSLEARSDTRAQPAAAAAS